jgi:serine/arginine repetitive matrix protein 1
MLNDFQGTNADQDNRFSDKEKKLLKQMKFEEILSKKVKNDSFLLFVIDSVHTERFPA